MPHPNRVSLVREDDAARTARQTRERERQFRGGDPGRGSPPRIVGAGTVKILTASAITARSGVVPGSGTVKLVTFDGTNLVATSTTYPAKNLSGTAGGTGKYGLAVSDGQYYWISSLEC